MSNKTEKLNSADGLDTREGLAKRLFEIFYDMKSEEVELDWTEDIDEWDKLSVDSQGTFLDMAGTVFRHFIPREVLRKL